MTRPVMLATIAPGFMISGNPSPITATIAYTYTLTALGGTGGYIFSQSGSLPSGISFADNGNGTCTIAGTVASGTGGLYPITLTLTDMSRNYRSKSYTLIVNELPLIFSGHAPNAISGTSYSYSYTISGGVSPYACSIQSGSLPAGLSLSAGGTISGTPSAFGTYPFTLMVVDSRGTKVSLNDSLASGFGVLTIGGALNGTIYDVGDTFSTSAPISGGSGVYLNPRVISGSLPSGLSLSISGTNLVLSGTALAYGSFSATVAVDSSDIQTATTTASIVIGDAFYSYVNSLLHFDASLFLTDQIGNTWINSTATQDSTSGNALFGKSMLVTTGGVQTPVANNPGTGDFVVELWYKTNTLQSGVILFDTRISPSDATGYAIYLNTGTLRFYAANADRIIGPSVSGNTAYRIALSRVSGVTRLFVNGAQVGSSYTDTNNYPNDTIAIGYQYSSGNGAANGNYDEFRYTVGVGRYSSNYTIDSRPFQNGGV